MTFPTDLEIAREAHPKPLLEIAHKMGIGEHLLEPYGSDVAKIRLDAIEELSDRPKAKYVVVTAVTPTPLGEGKTTTAVGLGQAMQCVGKNAVLTLRQPSMGPTFGIKGGAAGGGYSQVIPMELLNLHLTGDFHAVTAAHNLLSAMVDAHLHHGNELELDLNNITWRRVLDVNDRALRNIVIGLGGRMDGVVRQTGFDITAASEVMAILALATDQDDMRQRFGRIVVGYTAKGAPVTAE
jgi:formate--tetrahydrofolate ligase